jgi:hypothetical protein
VVKCYDILEEHTASIFKVTELVRVGAEVMTEKFLLLVYSDLRYWPNTATEDREWG